MIDIYHSYLGLAALATMKEPGIKQLDPVLCISIEQKELLSRLRRTALVPTRTYWKHGYSFSIREDDPDLETKMKCDEGNPSILV
jgi:geranylgeranyl transferase type-1 subunit beta